LLEGYASSDVYYVYIYVDGYYEATAYPDSNGDYSAYLDLEQGYDTLIEVYAYDSYSSYLDYDYWYVDVYGSSTSDYAYIEEIGYAYYDGDWTYEDYDGASGNLLEGYASGDVYSVDVYVDDVYETTLYTTTQGYFSGYVDVQEGYDVLVEVYAYDYYDTLLASDSWTIDVYESTGSSSSVEISQVGWAYYSGDYTQVDWNAGDECTTGNLLEGTASSDVYYVYVYVDNAYEATAYPDSTGYYSTCLDLEEGYDVQIDVYAYDSSSSYVASDSWDVDVYESSQTISGSVEIDEIGWAYYDGDYTRDGWDSDGYCSGVYGDQYLEGYASSNVYLVDVYVDGYYEATAYPDSQGYFAECIELEPASSVTVSVYAYDSGYSEIASDSWSVEVREEQ
jgi:hypothetical protein